MTTDGASLNPRVLRGRAQYHIFMSTVSEKGLLSANRGVCVLPSVPVVLFLVCTHETFDSGW